MNWRSWLPASSRSSCLGHSLWGLPGGGAPPLAGPRWAVTGQEDDASLPVAILRLPLVPSMLGHCPLYTIPVAVAFFFIWWWWCLSRGVGQWGVQCDLVEFRVRTFQVTAWIRKWSMLRVNLAKGWRQTWMNVNVCFTSGHYQVAAARCACLSLISIHLTIKLQQRCRIFENPHISRLLFFTMVWTSDVLLWTERP